jgi:hypothetical protein
MNPFPDCLKAMSPDSRYRQVTKSYRFQEISINLVVKLANPRLVMALKPAAELRGIGAQMIGAGPATASSAADAVPFAVPNAVAVAGGRSAIEVPTKLVDSSRL